MGHVHLRSKGLGHEPVAGQRKTGNPGGIAFHLLFPALEVHRPGERGQQHKLRHRYARLVRQRDGRLEGVRPVGGQSKDKGTQDVHAVFPESAEPAHQLFARTIEILEDGFQPFLRHRFNAHQRPLNPGLVHGVQELEILCRLHGDLRKEHHALGQLGQARHQLEPLRAHGPQFRQPRLVIFLLGQPQVFERDRIKIVVRQRNVVKSHPAQFHNFSDDRVRCALAWALAVRAPDRTKRAMLGASAHGLDRSPHVAVARHQVPPCRQELVALDVPPVIEALGSPVAAIGQHLRPNHVSIALHGCMRAPQFVCLFRVETGVNTTEDHRGTALARHPPHFVPPQGVAAVDSDSDHVPRLNLCGVDLLQRFVNNHRIPEGARRGCRNHVKPPGCNYAYAKR